MQSLDNNDKEVQIKCREKKKNTAGGMNVLVVVCTGIRNMRTENIKLDSGCKGQRI
jgi:hypothetical protein